MENVKLNMEKFQEWCENFLECDNCPCWPDCIREDVDCAREFLNFFKEK